jgi:ketosteroid isomerase-like protein
VAPVAPQVKPVEKLPEPAKTEKAPDTKAASTTLAKPAGTESTEGEITKALQNWASAWARKDVKGYLAHYASDFQTPGGVPRKTWEAERTQRIDKPGKLQVSVEDVKVSLAGDKATVKFRQHYSSASLKSSTGKTVVFVRSGSKWLILQERVG